MSQSTVPVSSDSSGSRETIMCLISALESVCKEFAKVKAEVACIAVYDSEALVVGSKKGRTFLDTRKDFQKDFLQYCNLQESSVPKDRIIKSPMVEIDSLRKSVEDLFCICYGKALGKSTPVPVPYDKMTKDPTAVIVCGLPKEVPVRDPSKYDLHTLKQILDNKTELYFIIKRPFIDQRKLKSKEEEISEDTDGSFSESFVPVQVKTEPSDDSEGSVELTTVTVKEEEEDLEYYKFNFQEDFQQNTEDRKEAAECLLDISSGEESEECTVGPAVNTNATDKFDFMLTEENRNTLRKTMFDIQNLQTYFSTHFNETRPIYEIPPAVLCNLLSRYFVNVKKKDNSDYEPVTLRSIFQSVERYLKQMSYSSSLSTDEIFKPTRDALKLKQRELKTKGKGCKQNASDELTEELINQLYLTKQLGPHNACSLQNTMWLNNCIYFGIRGNNEMRQLKWGDILLREDEHGSEYLQYDKEQHLKNPVGASHSKDKQRPKAFACPKNPERCPVMNYKIFLHHRPSRMLEPSAPFYLAINWNPSLQQHDPQWYKNQPLGIHSIETILKTMIQRAGIHTERRITNYSATKLLLQKLQEPDLSAISKHHKVFEHGKSSTQNPSDEYSRTKEKRQTAECSRHNIENLITQKCVPQTPSFSHGIAVNNHIASLIKPLGNPHVAANRLCVNGDEASTSSSPTCNERKRKFISETND